MNSIKSIIILSVLLNVINTRDAHASADAAFTIDDLGNTEFFGDVKIGSKMSPVKLTLNDDILVSIPIGTVIDWWRPNDSFNIPQKFSICDGRLIDDFESPYVGSILPDLMEKFTRGASGLNTIGDEGGHNRLPINIRTTDDGSHNHNCNRTQLISSGGDDPGLVEYMIQDEGRWTSREHIRVAAGGCFSTHSSKSSGNHRHDLSPTDHSGLHNHGVYFEVDTVPSYVGLLKIMRIK
jgi:hypothetical protein